MVFSNTVLLLLSLLVVNEVISFKWDIHESISAQGLMTFSERYMFQSGNGPPIMPDSGDSYIELDINFAVFSKVNSSNIPVAMAIYHADDGYFYENLDDICSPYAWDLEFESEWANNIYNEKEYTGRGFPITASKKMETITHLLTPGLVGNYQSFANIYFKYHIVQEGWHNVVFKICGADGSDSPEDNVIGGKLNGVIAFKNPYGFLSAEMWGYIPFWFARFIAVSFCGLIFCWLCISFKESVFAIHYGVLITFFVAALESLAWIIAYEMLNETGKPFCCPYPSEVLLASGIQVFRQTFSRCLLLIVALGYGIARPKLHSLEVLGVIIVTVLYFIACVVAKGAEVELLNDSYTDNTMSQIETYEIPELILNVFFLSWIFIALSNTIKTLEDSGQTIKLSMFLNLQWSIFSIFIVVLTTHFAFIYYQRNYLDFPWKYDWLDTCLWEVFNFFALVAAAIICKPSPVFALRMGAAQLSQNEDDDGTADNNLPDCPDDDDDGIEMSMNGSTKKFSSTEEDGRGEYGLGDSD